MSKIHKKYVVFCLLKQFSQTREKFKVITTGSSHTTWCVFHIRKIQLSETEWSSNRHAPEVQLLHAVHFRSRWTQKSWSRYFLIYLKTTGISFMLVQVLGRRKLKKLLWETFVQKEYYLCNIDEWVRKLQTKICHRSSTWKQQEVRLL